LSTRIIENRPVNVNEKHRGLGRGLPPAAPTAMTLAEISRRATKQAF
jgi:hypothetical protein